MSRHSQILRAGEYKKGLENYKDALNRRLENPSTKRSQAGTPTAPTNRPRTEVAVRPYGRDAGGNGYLLKSASKASFAQVGEALKNRTKTDNTTLSGAASGKGFTPAKVSFFVPANKTGTGATYEKASDTQLNYVKRPGVSYTYPHGALTDKEEYSKGAAAVKNAIKAKYPGYDYLRVSLSNEKF